MPEKNVIRFCVGNPGGARSAVWRLFVTRDDVYLFFRRLAHVVKVSLHDTGDWQMAITYDYATRNRKSCAIDGGRFFEKWRPIGQLILPRVSKYGLSHMKPKPSR